MRIGSAVAAITASAHTLPAAVSNITQAAGAFLLLAPWQRRVGALLVVLSAAARFVTALSRADLRLDLLVYAAGAVLVAVHDATLRTPGTALGDSHIAKAAT